MIFADANPSLRTTYKPPVGLNILTHSATSGECSSNKDDVSSPRSVSCRECNLEPVVLPHLDTLEPFVNIASVKTTMQSKPLKGTKSSRLQSILKLVPSASQRGIVRDRPVELKSAASTKNGIIPKKRDDERKNLVSERGLGKPSIGRNDLSVCLLASALLTVPFMGCFIILAGKYCRSKRARSHAFSGLCLGMAKLC